MGCMGCMGDSPQYNFQTIRAAQKTDLIEVRFLCFQRFDNTYFCTKQLKTSSFECRDWLLGELRSLLPYPDLVIFLAH